MAIKYLHKVNLIDCVVNARFISLKIISIYELILHSTTKNRHKKEEKKSTVENEINNTNICLDNPPNFVPNIFHLIPKLLVLLAHV